MNISICSLQKKKVVSLFLCCFVLYFNILLIVTMTITYILLYTMVYLIKKNGKNYNNSYALKP